MRRDDYIHASTRIRVFEKGLLRSQTMERLIDATNIEEALKILQETQYSQYTGLIETPAHYEIALSKELERVYKELYDVSNDHEVIDLTGIKYYYHNLKVLAKERITGESMDQLLIPVGSSDQKNLRELFSDRGIKLETGFGADAVRAVLEDYEEKKDPQRIDIIFDAYYFRELLHTAKELDVPLFIRYAQDSIDFTNLKTLLRAKKQNKPMAFLDDVLVEGGNLPVQELMASYNDSVDILKVKVNRFPIADYVKKALDSYGETNVLSEFDKEMDNYIVALAQESRNILTGPEPLFGYAIAKETEIKNLRIVLGSKLNDIPTESIRERLRELYV